MPDPDADPNPETNKRNCDPPKESVPSEFSEGNDLEELRVVNEPADVDEPAGGPVSQN